MFSKKRNRKMNVRAYIVLKKQMYDTYKQYILCFDMNDLDNNYFTLFNLLTYVFKVFLKGFRCGDI